MTCGRYIIWLRTYCTLPADHAGACGNLQHKYIDLTMNVQEMRQRVQSCRDCDKDRGCTPRFPDPKPGFGPFPGHTGEQRAKLMIIGQNPPKNENRRQWGAWMLHYSEEKFGDKMGPHERLIRRLVVDELGYKPSEVYATQAVKCPTHFNKTPDRIMSHRCAANFLRHEFFACRPRVVICFGRVAADSFGQVLGSTKTFHNLKEWQLDFRGTNVPGNHQMRAYGNVLEVQHPFDALEDEGFMPSVIETSHTSYARRFLDTEQWIDTVKKAHDWLLEKYYGEN